VLYVEVQLGPRALVGVEPVAIAFAAIWWMVFERFELGVLAYLRRVACVIAAAAAGLAVHHRAGDLVPRAPTRRLGGRGTRDRPHAARAVGGLLPAGDRALAAPSGGLGTRSRAVTPAENDRVLP